MDALSRLVRLARLRGSVDIRCLVAGRYTRDHPQAEAGRVPFHLLLDGVCEMELKGGRRIKVVAGDMVLLPHGTAHRIHVVGRRTAVNVEIRNVGPYELFANGAAGQVRSAGNVMKDRENSPVDLFCGHYSWEPGPGQVLMDMLPEVVHVPIGGPAPDGSPCSAGHLGSLSDFMRGEAGNAAPGTEAILDALCDVLLTMALRCTQGLERTVWLASAERAVRTVTEAVLHDPAHDWGIEKFAALTSMSRATFIRHFARETGMTPGDFLTRLRILLAADLLTSTDYSISSIATAVGYGSESAFGRAFRLVTGSSPARLRRSAQEQAHHCTRLAGNPLEHGQWSADHSDTTRQVSSHRRSAGRVHQ